MNKKKNVNQLIGYKLKIAREQNELTQKKVAEEINFSSSQLSNIECGRRTAPIDLVLLLTKIYNKDPVVFLADIVNQI